MKYFKFEQSKTIYLNLLCWTEKWRKEKTTVLCYALKSKQKPRKNPSPTSQTTNVSIYGFCPLAFTHTSGSFSIIVDCVASRVCVCVGDRLEFHTKAPEASLLFQHHFIMQVSSFTKQEKIKINSQRQPSAEAVEYFCACLDFSDHQVFHISLGSYRSFLVSCTFCHLLWLKSEG